MTHFRTLHPSQSIRVGLVLTTEILPDISTGGCTRNYLLYIRRKFRPLHGSYHFRNTWTSTSSFDRPVRSLASRAMQDEAAYSYARASMGSLAAALSAG